MSDGVCDKLLKSIETSVCDHCTAIDMIAILTLLSFRAMAHGCIVECAATAQSGDPWLDSLYKVVLHAIGNEETLDPDTVLAHGLETRSEN